MEKVIELLNCKIFTGKIFPFWIGWRVHFWKDRWCGDNLLCVVFPSLFALSASKDPWLVGGKGWTPCFSRSFNDWEVVCMERFLAFLQRQRVCGDVQDTLIWSMTKSGKFTVKSLYNVLEPTWVSLFQRAEFRFLASSPKLVFLHGRQCGVKF